MRDFLKDLNSEQRKAVMIDKGPILILAGAGSGKTRVITYRIAYLIHERNVNPRNIMGITFTNKAADEMRNRVTKLLADENYKVWIKTFHSTCARILRWSSQRIGIPQNFTIYDEHDQLLVIKECLEDLKLNPKRFTPQYVATVINNAKENFVPFDEIPDHFIRPIYKLYEKKLTKYNALDFEDLILKVVKLFKKDKAALEYYQEQFKYILVDEYQDTNRAQYAFTNLLAKKYRNLCVVGDDDQSIYSWRGAEIENILNFENDYPDVKIIKLEQNYRSTKTILRAASDVVKNNYHRRTKTLWCSNETGERIEFFEARDNQNEAQYIAKKILGLRLKNYNLGNIAIFYRINYQSRGFEEAFVKYQIPYEVVGSLKFYERAEIKNVLAYLRSVENPADSISLKRIINIPSRKIGYDTVSKITEFQRTNRISFFEGLKLVNRIPNINKNTKKRIENFVRLIEHFMEIKEKLDLYNFASRVLHRSGYYDSLKEDKTEKEYARRKNVEELLISIKDYVETSPDVTLQDYLASVSLRSEIDEWQNSEDRVSLMTLHNAKGLEFEVVFITGLEDGLIPHRKSSNEQKQYEEERRLLYVGITRARKKLFLTRALRRNIYARGFVDTKLSPFFKEIPQEVFATNRVSV